jgi:basic membrane lipoprotein Med (substrate-binding protein (PBP1-ABC) superfamily)
MRLIRRCFGWATVILLVACGQTGGATSTAGPTPGGNTGDPNLPGVALVTNIGRINDGTFNQFAYEGALRAAQEFNLDLKFIETQSPADFEQNIRTFVDEGFEVIVTVGFPLQDATLAAARTTPNVRFIGVDQDFSAAAGVNNLIGLQFREDQAGFLAGALAGMMSASGVVGFVGGPDIPPVRRFGNGFMNGAHYIQPGIDLLSVNLDSFVDPTRGGSTADQMIGEGANVIFGAGGATGSGAIRTAGERGVYVIGVDQDEFVTTFGNGTAPGADKILTSVIKRVDVAVYEQIAAIVGGSFSGGGNAIYGAENGGIGLAPFHQAEAAIPQAVRERLDQTLAALADGSLSTGVDPVSGNIDEASVPEANPFTP